MDILIKIIGVAFICLGAFYLSRPAVIKQLMAFLQQGNRIYLAGLIRLVLAVVFLLAARECDLSWVIGLLGIIFLASGLVIFAVGPEKLKPLLDWFQRQSIAVVRFVGLLPIAIGALIIYSA